MLRIAAAAFGACVLVLVAVVQAQQWLLRWRAERLLKDIRAIQMGKSNVTDAKNLMRKWGAWGEWQGNCDKDWCEFHVWLDDISNALGRFPVLDNGQWVTRLRWLRWVNRPYPWAGGRFEEVEADFEVRHGVIWSKSFAVLITPLPEKYDTRGELMPLLETSVMGRARSSSNCFHSWRGAAEVAFSASNPELCLDVVDERGHWAFAQFTPFADESTIRQLMDFNLACITSWKGCRTARGLMPATVAMFDDYKHRGNATNNQSARETFPLWIVARDSEYVAIGEALRPPGRVFENKFAGLQSFRIVKLLKGDRLISGAGIYEVNTEGSEEICPLLSDAQNTPGVKVLMFFDEPLNRDPARESDFSECSVMPLTDQNLIAAQRGIARDTIFRDSAVY